MGVGACVGEETREADAALGGKWPLASQPHYKLGTSPSPLPPAIHKTVLLVECHTSLTHKNSCRTPGHQHKLQSHADDTPEHKQLLQHLCSQLLSNAQCQRRLAGAGGAGHQQRSPCKLLLPAEELDDSGSSRAWLYMDATR